MIWVGGWGWGGGVVEGGGSSPPSPYTPIILLHRCLQGVDTVVGSTGALCCKTPIIEKGTVGGQTALMCAAKGCSCTAKGLC